MRRAGWGVRGVPMAYQREAAAVLGCSTQATQIRGLWPGDAGKSTAAGSACAAPPAAGSGRALPHLPLRNVLHRIRSLGREGNETSAALSGTIPSGFATGMAPVGGGEPIKVRSAVSAAAGSVGSAVA